MRLAITACLLFAAEAGAQVCSIQLSCPGSGGGPCSGSACNGEVTFSWAATCDRSGFTSCVISATSGESCNCLNNSQCSVGEIKCPCHKPCGSGCLDGTNDQCCNGVRAPADQVCCPDGHFCASGQACCGTGCMNAGDACCGAGAGVCTGGLACCQDGIAWCAPPGSSCCADGTYCPSGSDCVDGHCCPRLTPESSPFTAYDATSGYCCGDTSCYATGTCEAGHNTCVCSNPCGNGLCCSDGMTCCPHKGWCSKGACPYCPAGTPLECGQGCMPMGAVCCGGGYYCPNGLSCADCGGSVPCCGGGGPSAQSVAMPMMAADGGAVPSYTAAQSDGTATVKMTKPGAVTGPSTSGCGGGAAPGSSGLGVGCRCSGGGGGLLELMAFGLLLRFVRRRSR